MDLEAILQREFGFTAFRPGQKNIIQQLLAGQDVLGILPTATGKSLCYQFPGRLLTGAILIVSPLLSLMEDQQQQLQLLGERKVLALNSQLSFQEKQYALRHIRDYHYILTSPETLHQEEVLQALKQLQLALFVVDEAHCISQWGVDFRPEYLKLPRIQQALGQPQTLALTATASPLVQAEIQELILQTPFTERGSVDRPNIGLMVQETTDKWETLVQLLPHLSRPGIIYCATRKKVEQLNQVLREAGYASMFYHGGLASDERLRIQQQFQNGQAELLCATNAFGMGINHQDVRFVLHYELSSGLENYVQEFGRAGRDGQPALAILLYQKQDERIHHFFQQETQQNRLLLEALQTSAREEIAQLVPNLPELQQKWLLGYLHGEYDLPELIERIRQKEVERSQQLQAMIHYIETKECRRRVIQRYFGDPEISQPPEVCCDNCGLELTAFYQEPAAIPESPTEWSAILKTLFFS